MTVNSLDFLKARENARAILEELRLDAYIFEVEPNDVDWLVIVECACNINGGWERIALKVPKQMLLENYQNYPAKSTLFDYWKKKLINCKLKVSG